MKQGTMVFWWLVAMCWCSSVAAQSTVVLTPANSLESASAAPLMSLSELTRTWDRHLLSISDDDAQEWKLREQLSRHPMQVSALDELIEVFDRNEEKTLRAAAMQYAARTGQNNFSQNLTRFQHDIQEVVMRAEAGDRVSDPFVETRLEIFYERLNRTDRLAISLSEYDRIEAELRELLKTSDQQKSILIALSDYYDHRRETCMGVMVAMLALRIDPGHPEMLDRCFTMLARPGFEHMQELMVTYYAQRNDANLSVTVRFVERSKALGMEEATLRFLVRSARLNPENPLYWQELGGLLFARRNYQDAIAALEQAAKLPGHDPKTYHTLALVLHHSGDESNMLYWLQRWRDRVNDDQIADALLNRPFNLYPQLLGKLD